jgi:RHS repeat-associated protein
MLLVGLLVAQSCATRRDRPLVEVPDVVYVYDAVGRLRAVTDPEGETSAYSYDPAGNLLSVDRYPSERVSVIEVVPLRAPVGAEVRVQGTGFAAKAGRNEVSFGGAAAEVTQASPVELTVVVPEGATTGPVKVAAGGASAASDVRFEVELGRSPVVESFAPDVVGPGDEVRIQGENFTGDPLLDLVVLGDRTYATAVSASETELVVRVPPSASSGRLSVSTPSGTARSDGTLVVAPPGSAAADVGSWSEVELDEPSTVEVEADQLALLTFRGEQDRRLGLELSGDGLGCQQLAIGLYDPSGLELVDPDAPAPLPSSDRTGGWCPGDDPASDILDGAVVLPASGPYTVSLAGRGRDGTARVRLHDHEPEDGVEPTSRGRSDDEPDGGAGDDPSREPGEPVAAPDAVIDGVERSPVDLGTGALLFEETDLLVPDHLLPVALTRGHQPTGDPSDRPPSGASGASGASEAFGLGSALEFDMELKPSSARQYAELMLSSGLSVVFDRVTGGTDRETAVFEHSTTPTAFFGATITWDGIGWDLTLDNGVILEFTPDGPLRAIRDRDGNATTIRREAAGTDERGLPTEGRVVSVHSPTGRWLAFEYDDQDRIAQARNHVGDAVSYSYDERGLLQRAVLSPTGSEGTEGWENRYDYDGLGRVSHISSGDEEDGLELTIGYDAAGRVAVQRLADGSEFRFSYGTTVQATEIEGIDEEAESMVLPDGTETVYRYGDDGLLESIGQGDTRAAVSHDAAGRVERLDLPNDVTTTYEYDGRGLLSRLAYDVDGDSFFDHRYRYDPTGRRSGLSGERLTIDPPSPRAAARYGPGNELTELGTEAESDEGPLDYDDAGNLVDDGTNTYTWDARGRLVAIDGEVEARFSYDPFGRRTQKTVDGSTTSYVFDGHNVVQTRHESADGADSNGSTATYLTGPGLDEIYARTTDDGSVTTYLTDPQGSVIGLVGADGEAATWYSYDPFGATTIHGEADPNPFTFTGRELDETGLHYYRARYYSAEQGRFISQDPIGFTAGDPNLYVYAANDPVNQIDPTGLQPISPVALAICAAGIVYWASVVGGNYEVVLDILDPEGDIQLGTEEAAIELDRVNRENLAAMEVFLATCSLLFIPGLGGALSRGVTSFGRGLAARFPSVASRLAPRTAVTGSRTLATGPRAPQMARLSRSFTYGDPGHGALGATDKFGNITIRPGLSPKDFTETLRHETVHSVMSPRQGTFLASFRADLRMAGYRYSNALRYTEEALAEGYATKSVAQGLRFPFVGGYVTPAGLLFEGLVIGNGPTYLGYEAVTGD